MVPLLVHPAPAVADAALARVPHDPQTLPARALRPRHRWGLLWRLLAQAGAPVHDPAVCSAAVELLSTAAGTVADLAAELVSRH